MSDNDPIGKALGLPEKNSFVENIIAAAHDDSATADFDMARSNIREVITNGSEAIFKLTEIAEQSQHPRAYEVLAKLMDSVVNANKELLELQTKIRSIQASDSPINERAQSVTNNLFVGSTAELQKVIAEMRK
jgi:predicted transcriptional regulator